MVQFKNVFTGQEKRPYSRATTAQKCVRAGGKHNDLDNVGYTARHHTFFEMLGNFTFGDYFKPQAIELAWNLVTKDFGLPPTGCWSRLCRGRRRGRAVAQDRRPAGRADHPHPDLRQFLAHGRHRPVRPVLGNLLRPRRPHPRRPARQPDEDGDRFIEIWNLVFMQFEEGPPGTRVPLPRPSIDTGMGLERFAAILQGKHDNYDTDTLRALILASAEATGQDPDGPHKVSHRVVADHLRSTVVPDRRRRAAVATRAAATCCAGSCAAPCAMLHMMGAREPLMYRLVPALVRQMGAAYPELGRAEALIAETLRLEETRFKAMLERGLHLLAEETGAAGRRASRCPATSRSGSTTPSASRST